MPSIGHHSTSSRQERSLEPGGSPVLIIIYCKFICFIIYSYIIEFKNSSAIFITTCLDVGQLMDLLDLTPDSESYESSSAVFWASQSLNYCRPDNLNLFSSYACALILRSRTGLWNVIVQIVTSSHSPKIINLTCVDFLRSKITQNIAKTWAWFVCISLCRGVLDSCSGHQVFWTLLQASPSLQVLTQLLSEKPQISCCGCCWHNQLLIVSEFIVRGS